MSTATARSSTRTPARPGRRSSSTRRQSLRVVDRRRRSIRRSAAVSLIVLVGLLFGALVMWVSVITGQGRLDDIRTAIAEEQERRSHLVTAENEVQSPDEVLRIARDELGMTPSAIPELVTPPAEVIAPSADAPLEAGAE